MTTLGTLIGRIKITTEPVAWIGLGLVVLQIVQLEMNHQSITNTVVNSLLTALAAIIGRQSVTPVAKLNTTGKHSLPPIK